MKYLKIIFAFLVISFLALTANAQQSNNKEAADESDFWVGRTHYEDDLVFDSFENPNEPANNNTVTNSIVPEVYKLYENYPNPFNPSTSIRFSIPEKGYVTLAVYDITGREVKTLLSSQKEPGAYEISFDASGFASGLYFCRITVNNFSDVKKMILTK